MNFLDKIDLIHAKYKLQYHINGDDTTFHSFIPITPKSYSPTCVFVIKKQEKSKLLCVFGKQRVYLSDLNIIETILSMKKEEIKWFLDQFIKLFQNLGVEVEFEIEDFIVKGFGIECYPTTRSIALFSDSDMSVNDFIFLINFVFIKDRAWEESKNILNFSKITLCKYISLIDYYGFSSECSKQYLENIGYDISNEKPKDNKYIDGLFNDIEKFDISIYL